MYNKITSHNCLFVLNWCYGLISVFYTCQEIACVSAQLMLFCSSVKPTQNKVYLILSLLGHQQSRQSADNIRYEFKKKFFKYLWLQILLPDNIMHNWEKGNWKVCTTSPLYFNSWGKHVLSRSARAGILCCCWRYPCKQVIMIHVYRDAVAITNPQLTSAHQNNGSISQVHNIPEAHFTTVVQIGWKSWVVVISFLALSSIRIFAHGMGHVQKLATIS